MVYVYVHLIMQLRTPNAYTGEMGGILGPQIFEEHRRKCCERFKKKNKKKTNEKKTHATSFADGSPPRRITRTFPPPLLRSSLFSFFLSFVSHVRTTYTIYEVVGKTKIIITLYGIIHASVPVYVYRSY